MSKKSIAGGVLGIIGSVFALIGVIGLALCATLVDAGTNAVEGATGAGVGTNFALWTWILGIAAFAIGLVGSIMCFQKAMIGGILLLVAVVVMLVLGFVVAFSILNIIAMVLLALGGILAFVVKK